jgi:heme A synthase
MKPKIWLRIACLFILIHLIGHAVGHATWDNPEDPKMKEVVDAMVGHEGEFMGATRSMGDYYNGYSLILFFVYAMSIAIVWVVSSLPESHKISARKILFPVAFAYLAFGVIEFSYFFPFAAAMSLGAGVLILLGVFRMGDPSTEDKL